MSRHRFDPVSFVLGILFAAVGLTFLFGNADIGDLHLAVVWPLPLILIGLLMLVSAIQRRGRSEPRPVPASAPAPTVATGEIDGLDRTDQDDSIEATTGSGTTRPTAGDRGPD